MPPCKYPPQPQAARASAGRLPHLSHSSPPPLLAPAALKLAAGSARVYTVPIGVGSLAAGGSEQSSSVAARSACSVTRGRRRQPRLGTERERVNWFAGVRCCPFQERSCKSSLPVGLFIRSVAWFVNFWRFPLRIWRLQKRSFRPFSWFISFWNLLMVVY